MKNEFWAEEIGKLTYGQPVLADLGDLKTQTLGDTVSAGGDATSNT